MSRKDTFSNALVALSYRAFLLWMERNLKGALDFAGQGGEPMGCWEPRYSCAPPLLLLLMVTKEMGESLSWLEGDEYELTKLTRDVQSLKFFKLLLVLGANPDFSDYNGVTLMSWMETEPKSLPGLPRKLGQEVSGFLKMDKPGKETYISKLKKEFKASREYKEIVRFNPRFEL
jgi:hypothetical protein